MRISTPAFQPSDRIGASLGCLPLDAIGIALSRRSACFPSDLYRNNSRLTLDNLEISFVLRCWYSYNIFTGDRVAIYQNSGAFTPSFLSFSCIYTRSASLLYCPAYASTFRQSGETKRRKISGQKIFRFWARQHRRPLQVLEGPVGLCCSSAIWSAHARHIFVPVCSCSSDLSGRCSSVRAGVICCSVLALDLQELAPDLVESFRLGF